MLRWLLRSEATETNGAINACQSPNQKPATTSCSLAVRLNSLGPATHPVRMFSSSPTNTSKTKEDFIAIPPLPMLTKQGHEKSQNDRQMARRPVSLIELGRPLFR